MEATIGKITIKIYESNDRYHVQKRLGKKKEFEMIIILIKIWNYKKKEFQ